MGLAECAAEHPLIFPVHPRTRHRLVEFGLDGYLTAYAQTSRARSAPPIGFVLTEPLGYLDFLCLMKNASLVVTDSGGIQEETTCLGVPCVTVRDSTERPVTVDLGTNVIAGTNTERIHSAVRSRFGRTQTGQMPELWDGQAAGRILERLISTVEEKSPTGMLCTAQV